MQDNKTLILQFCVSKQFTRKFHLFRLIFNVCFVVFFFILQSVFTNAQLLWMINNFGYRCSIISQWECKMFNSFAVIGFIRCILNSPRGQHCSCATQRNRIAISPVTLEGTGPITSCKRFWEGFSLMQF